MKYRIRMLRLKWFARIFDAGGNSVEDIGPFDKIAEAQAAADATGYPDWDKGLP